MKALAVILTATETIRAGMLVKKTASGNGAAKLGTADAASDIFGVAMNEAVLGQAVAVSTVPGYPVLLYSDGADQLVEGGAWGPSTAVAGAASGDPATQLGIVTQTAPNTLGALAQGIATPGGGAAPVTQSLQAAYDGGSTIECAAGDPVEVTVDPTNFDALKIKADDADIGTISGFDGSGGLVLYGAADQGARIAVRTQTDANTGAAAVVSAGRGGPTAGTGGNSSVVGGQGGTTNGAGGEARVTGGLGAGTGAGGAAKLTGGGNGGTANGGAASVTGGASTGSSGTGGAASVTGGASTNGTGGSVAIDAGDGATDGNINIGTSKAVNTNVQAASAVAVKLQSQANGAIDVGVSSTNLRGADANGACITLSANGIGGVPKLSFFGAATVVQQATPVVLADVIALLQAYGLCP